MVSPEVPTDQAPSSNFQQDIIVMLRAITQQMQDDKRDFNRRMDDLVSHADIATVVQRTIAENLETVINPMVKTAVSDAMATTIDLHNMDNAGAVNEEAPAINAVSQQLENENRAALEGGARRSSGGERKHHG